MSLIGEENLNKPDLKANTVEEVQLRNRRDANKAYAERMSYQLKQRREEKKRKIKEERFLTPERLLKRKIDRSHDKKRFNRQSKRLRQHNIRPEVSTDLLIVCCIRPIVDASKSSMQLLKELRLDKTYSAVFLRNCKEVIQKLVLLEPYLAWGRPDKTTVDELLTKHAYTIIDGKRTAISDNTIVEDHLGDKDILCIADMQNEISHLGPAFENVCSFLAPFEFNAPISKLEHVVLHMNKISSGDQESKINDLIKSML